MKKKVKTTNEYHVDVSHLERYAEVYSNGIAW